MVERMTFRFLFFVLLQLLNSKLSTGFFSKFFPFKPKVVPEQISNIIAVEPEIMPVIDPIEKNDLKLGVLLLNLGGPQTQQDVEGFLYNLFADPDIIRLPPVLSILQQPIAYVIAKRRAPQSTAAYQSIGGGSPIVNYTQAQANLIAKNLCDKGLDAKCYFAMRYWNPYTEEVLEKIHADGINSLVILPLYPQYSISTSGSSLKLLQELFIQQPKKWGPDKIQHTVVTSWYQRPGYINTMAELILDDISHYTPEQMQEGVHVLFSAHGVPESYIKAGDPYKRQIEECVRLIASQVTHLIENGKITNKKFDSATSKLEKSTKPFPSQFDETNDLMKELGTGKEISSRIRYHLSFQSRVGPVQWLQPYTEEVVTQLGKEGVKNLIAVPVSFVSEHIETLEEMDMEYRELAEANGVENWRRTPAVNTDARFIDDMADLVVESLQSPMLSLSEAMQTMDLMDDNTAGPLLSIKNNGLSTDAMNGLNSRVAMLGVLSTSVLELLSGHHPIVHMVGLK